MRSLLLTVFFVGLAGCSVSDGGDPSPLTLSNRADRAVVAFVFEREQLALIDPHEALRAEHFDALKLEPGATVAVPEAGSYEPGDAVVAFVYARRARPSAAITERHGAGAAELVGIIRLSARDLRKAGYRVVVREAE